MFDSRLLGLIIVFAPLSLFSFGGGQAIVADIQHQTVGVHGWLTDQQFTDMFALSRAAPVPEPPAGELAADLVLGDRQSGGKPLDDRHQRPPMGLARGQKAQHTPSLCRSASS